MVVYLADKLTEVGFLPPTPGLTHTPATAVNPKTTAKTRHSVREHGIQTPSLPPPPSGERQSMPHREIAHPVIPDD